MLTLANGFAVRGHHVDLVLVKAEGPYLTHVNPAVRIVDLDSTGVIRCLPSLVRYIRRNRPDSILSAMSHANIAAIAARMIARVPLRLVISERASLSGAERHLTTLKDRILFALMRRLYGRADAITVVAKAITDELVDRFRLDPTIIHMIHNPIVSDELRHKALEPPGHPWFEDVEIPIILGAGRLSRQKDFPSLIRAFALVRKTRNARLMIIGEGADRQQLEQLAEDLGCASDVCLPGFIENPFAFMKGGAVFVLSSTFEGMPGTLIQAMACGTRVVSTDCPTGPREILEDGKWGSLVPMGDVGAIADAIISALDIREGPAVEIRAAAFNEEHAVTHYLEVMGAAPFASDRA